MNGTVDNSLKLQQEVQKLAKDIKAFSVIVLDNKGMVKITNEGNLMEMAFMSIAFQDLITKIMNGQLQKVGPSAEN